ncbi:MAG: hypothetical protein NT049_15845, partial [Planctomycetota bacterium]|nr:hypothetical protein [Planctomycetota bacterium]
QDLNQLPTSSLYDTSIVWDLSGIQTTGGTFYLIQYDLPLYEVVPAPAAVVSGAVGLLLLGGVGGIRRRFRKCRSALH